MIEESSPWSRFSEAAIPFAQSATIPALFALLAGHTGATGLMSLLGNQVGNKLGGALGLGYDASNLAGTGLGFLSAYANRKSPMNAISYLLSTQLGAAQQARDWEQIPKALPGPDDLNPSTPEGLSQYLKDAGFTARGDGSYQNQSLTPEMFAGIGALPDKRLLVSSPRLGAGKYYMYNENNSPVLKAADAESMNPIDLEAAQLERHLAWMERAKLKKITDRFRWIG